ncbi:SPT2 chromatin protein [Euphorbia peplus]|nr:SPT2 chromatin protein [Euphorbia peplus]
MVEHEYLELREKLKEAYRSKIRRTETGESSGKIMSPGKDNYGSFFGPSVTLLPPTLVKITKSLAENFCSNNKSFCSVNKDLKTTKTQMIKESRDYSFLLSDNQESKPVPTDNGQELDLEKRVSVGKSVGTLENQDRPKVLPSKTTLDNVENKAKMQQRVRSEPESKTRVKLLEATTPSRLADVKKIKPVDQKQPLCRNSEKRPSSDVKQPPLLNLKKRPVPRDNGQELVLEKRVSVCKSVGTLKKQNIPKLLPSKTSLENGETKAKMQQKVKLELEPKTRMKLTKATPQKPDDVKKIKPVDQKQPLCRNSEKRPSNDVKQPPLRNLKKRPILTYNGQELDLEKRVSVCKSVGTLKKQNIPKVVPSKTSLDNGETKAKMQQRVKSEPDLKTRVKLLQTTPPKPADVKKSKPVDQKQPLCRNSEKRPSKAVDQKKQPAFGGNSKKKRALEDDGCYEEGENALDMVRKMFNTKRFAGRDDSDRVMEVGFGDIVKEEKISERLGKKEDDEQLRLILEEEKRSQMAKRRRGLVAK